MATFKSFSKTDDDTAGYDPVLTVPASAVEGDKMVVVVTTVDNEPDITPTAPATETWTLERGPIEYTPDTGSPPASWIYSKDVSADDETNAGSKTYTWTFSGSEQQHGFLVHTSAATYSDVTPNTASAVTIDAPSIDTTVNNTLVVFIGVRSADNFWDTLPTGLDAQLLHDLIGSATETTTGALGCIAAYRNEYASPSTTGAKTFTYDTQIAGSVHGITFMLEPTGGLPDFHGANRGILRGVGRGVG